MNTEVAAGSVAGRMHRRLARPNQDAVSWIRARRGVVLVVCDGCGGAPRSEVGAALGARLWSRALVERLDAVARSQTEHLKVLRAAFAKLERALTKGRAA